MSGSLNKVMLIGNLGGDPEIRTIPNGPRVANFSLATSEQFTNQSGQKIDKTEWHRIVMWRGLADIAEQYLRKGSSIYIEGKLSTRSWDDQNGIKKYMTEIIVEKIQMLNNKVQNKKQEFTSETFSDNNIPPQPEDDLPF